ncbi:MAG: secondary thiamine-phosphate synthase enzyme YjbQ [Pseudomonadota bacterium]
MFQQTISVNTAGRGTYEITNEVQALVHEAATSVGLCHVFVAHTSASLTITENADPDVRRDLEVFFADLVPDDDARYAHSAEGPDDMPAHVRSVLSQTNLTVPISGARLLLGTWQGIYLWEHRQGKHQRRVTITIQD